MNIGEKNKLLALKTASYAIDIQNKAGTRLGLRS
jgi:hypothetical protein